MFGTLVPTRRNELVAKYATRHERDERLAEVVAEVREVLGVGEGYPITDLTAAQIGRSNPELAKRLRLAFDDVMEIVSVTHELRNMPCGKKWDAAHKRVQRQLIANQAARQQLERKRDRIWAAIQDTSMRPQGLSDARARRVALERDLRNVRAEFDELDEQEKPLRAEFERLFRLKFEADPQP